MSVPTTRSRSLLIGGVLLLGAGALLTVVFARGVLASVSAPDVADAAVLLAFVLLGGVQIFSGIQSIRQRRGSGRNLGLVVAVLGIAAAVLVMYAASTTSVFSVTGGETVPGAPGFTPVELQQGQGHALGIAISIIALAGFIGATVLLLVSRTRSL